ncbi:MAG: M67 family metallopeptidase [Kaiparowitsia implicata GSE-PSE-MK54-09C]|jgi:proteasome lid subunit RPN8/RPN11|nr:M67 family metallopeptidase [Kaiparowitsia implicata GSE-PSE-MK54-09C]
MTLHVSSQHLTDIRIHAEQVYPNECCGLLLGHIDRTTQTRTVVELWRADNRWSAEAVQDYRPHSRAIANDTDTNDADTNIDTATPLAPSATASLDKTRRYWIDPRDLLTAQRYGRDRQLDMIGVYHSHPNHSAVPSECDRTFAWVDYSYIIVSVLQGSAQDLLCWSLDDQHQFQPEALQPLTEDLS